MSQEEGNYVQSGWVAGYSGKIDLRPRGPFVVCTEVFFNPAPEPCWDPDDKAVTVTVFYELALMNPPSQIPVPPGFIDHITDDIYTKKIVRPKSRRLMREHAREGWSSYIHSRSYSITHYDAAVEKEPITLWLAQVGNTHMLQVVFRGQDLNRLFLLPDAVPVVTLLPDSYLGTRGKTS
jgi:hypothetical protein